MATVLRNLVRKSPAIRTITTSHIQASENLVAPCVFNQRLVVDSKQQDHPTTDILNPIFALPKTKPSISSPFSQFYPSFPFGFCLPQISSIGLVPSEVDYVQPDDSRRMWADSVKKKRKRKMNKHKYKKLRKRLRRQT